MDDKTKNIIYDWNGTLFDDFEPVFNCTNLLLEQEGHPRVSVEHFRERYIIPFRHFFEGMDLSDAQIARLTGLESNKFHDHYEPMADQVGLRDGASEILNHATKNGVTNVILSNHIVDPIRTQLRRLDIEHLFHEVLAYADRATQFKHMTKGERLRRYMKERNAQPHMTIIIGDTVEEIAIAREQGLVSVAITGGCVSEERLRDEKPDHVIHTLHDLKPILLERGFVS